MQITLKKKLLYTVYMITIILYSVYTIKQALPSSDIYWMISTGDYIVHNGVPAINPFTIHQNFKIIIQQWLYDVIIYKLFDIAYYNAILLFSIILYIIFILLLYYYINIISKNQIATIRITLLISLFMARIQAKFVNRPQFISLLIILCIYIILEKYKRSKNTIYLVILPFIALFQANIHSSFLPVIFVMMLPYICIESDLWKQKKFIKEWFNNNKLIIISMIIMMIVSLINPYKLQGITYLLNSYGNITTEAFISELKEPIFKSLEGITLIICIVLLTIYIYKYNKNINTTYITMASGTIILGMMHYRNIWLTVIGIVPILTIILQNSKNKEISFKKTMIIIVILLITNSFIINQTYRIKNKYGEDNSIKPEQAANYLDTYTDEIVLYNDFNSGGYLQFRGYKTYIDQRPEIYEKDINGVDDIYSEYIKGISTKKASEISEILDKYNFTHLLVRTSTKLDLYMQLQEDYKIVVEGQDYNLYEHIKN